jgi:hypothetical protein
MRSKRRFMNAIFTVVGSSLVLYAVMGIQSTQNRVLVVALGLVLVEAGVWSLTRSLLPNERKYTALRKETDYFMGLVRQLNRAAVKVGGVGDNESAETVTHVHAEMHHSVDRMLRLAGQADDD